MATEVLGRGVLEVVTDATKAIAGISDTRTALQKLKDQAKAAGESLTSSSTNYLRALEKQTTAVERQAATFGKSKGEIAAYNASQLGVSTTAAGLVSRLDAAEKSLLAQKEAARSAAGALATLNAAQLGGVKSTGLLAHQQQQLGFQLHDFFIQVQAGQSPLTAFFQQGSQLSGAFGGAGNAFRAVTSLLTPLRVAIGGAAAAVGTLGLAFYEGSKQSKAFADAVTLSGNFAGQTEGAFNSMTKSIAASSKATIGDVREFAQALIATGEIGPTVFSAATTAAVGYARATGKTAAEVAKDFSDMARSPAKWAAEHNRAFNDITSAQLDAIKAFEQNGRAADAQGVIYEALNARFPKLQANLGLIDRALQTGASAWSTFWNAAQGIGRAETIEDRLDSVAKKLKALRSGDQSTFGVVVPRGGFGAQRDEQISALEIERGGLLREQGTAFAKAQAAAEDAAAQKDAQAAGAFVDNMLKRAKSVGALKKALEEAQAQFNARARVGSPVSEVDQKAIVAQIRKDFAPPKASTSLSEAQRYLETLQKQTEGVDQLTAHERSLLDVQKGRLSGITPLLREQILTQATALDQLKYEEDQRRRLEDAIQQNFHDRLRAGDAAAAEAKKLLESNDVLAQENQLIGASAKARYALEQARLSSAIAVAKDKLATIESKDAIGVETLALRDQIEQLERRRGLLSDKTAMEAVAEETARAKQFADDLGSALANGATDAITHFNDLRSVLRSLDQQLVAIINRKLITEPLGNSISRWISSMGGGGGGGLGGLLGGLLGGGSAAAATGTDLALAGLPFFPLAEGTTRVPYDGFRASLHKDEAVIPARFNPALRPQSRGSSEADGGNSAARPRPIVVNVNMAPQRGVTRASAIQQGADTGAGIQRALARNT